MRERLLYIFARLLDAFGKRNWWPGETDLEIIVGAVLTQNTSWKNVEKAIENLKKSNALDISVLHTMDEDSLAQIIRPSGFYNIKAKRLKNIIKVIHDNYSANILQLKTIDISNLRRILLDIGGIGEETADSIILYALDKPIFVVDAYTTRFVKHHGLLVGDLRYDDIQKFFMENLPHDTYLFNEYHALIVRLCQTYCKKVPICRGCPLEGDMVSG